MPESIQYPLDDMHSTAHDLRSFISDQWTQHNALFMVNSDSFSALLKAIVHVIPDGAGKVNELEQRLESYHQQYQSAYKALYDLAGNIDSAAQSMDLTDQAVKDAFKSSQNTKP